MLIIMQLAFMSGSLDATNRMLEIANRPSLISTKAPLEPMYPLTGTELVNEASTVNKTQPVNVTQASTKQTSTKNEGGK